MDSETIDRLVKIVGKGGVLCTPEDLAVYSYDGTFVESRPDVIVLPETTEQVSEVVKLAAETRTPLIPRGMGSGLAAGSVPLPSGGIVVCLTRMNRILEIDAENATVRVEAGVVTADLQGAVEKSRAFLPARSVQHPAFDDRREHCVQCGRAALPEVRRDGRLRPGPDRRPGGWPDFEDRRQADQGRDRLRPERALHRFRRNAGADHRGAPAADRQAPLMRGPRSPSLPPWPTPRGRSTPS